MPTVALIAESLVATAQGRAVVGTGWWRVGIVWIRIAATGATQSGLVAILLVIELALVLEAGETGLDVVELGGGDDVVGPRGHDGGDLILGFVNAVRSLRVVSEDLGEGAGLVLLEGVDLFKELDEGLW